MLNIIKTLQEHKEILKNFKTFTPQKQKHIVNAVLAATSVVLYYYPKIKEINKIIKENPEKYAFLPYIIMFVCLSQFRMLYMLLNMDLKIKYLKKNNNINDIDITDIENRVKSLTEDLRQLNYKRYKSKNEVESRDILTLDLD